MISKIDLRDFFEINAKLYADDASQPALCEMIRRMIHALELQEAKRAALWRDGERRAVANVH
jgi:hypothetical protein